ncbi:hypothetical protein [Pseudomonas trivialis]|uniref:hypothetical protein n=1 Tax=Pseudomonas trivialis TaxID=200450 RepID=UPI0030D1809E
MEYLLIRLITVFDPALWPGLFLPVSLAWLQANEDCVLLDGAHGSKRPLPNESRPTALDGIFEKQRLRINLTALKLPPDQEVWPLPCNNFASRFCPTSV